MWSCLIRLDTPSVAENSYSHFIKQKDSIFCQVLYMKPTVEPENEGITCELPCGASKRILCFFFYEGRQQIDE